MNALTDTLKKMLNALAYADAGENLTGLQKARLLSQGMEGVTAADDTATVAAAPATTLKAGRQVALYIGSELPAEMMSYVVQTCARLKHGLTVLSFQTEGSAQATLEPYQEMLKTAGIDMQLVTLIGDPLPGLARYLRAHPEVAFLACKETGYLGRSLLNGTQRQSALPVPVVLVESHGGNARSLRTPAKHNTDSSHVA
ncbi:MAG: hypothetical protein KKE76_05470 [Gammaproteobacteria bacterium]|nr:hypothetical protein [Gammaproteobacteria bacterium]